MRRKHRIEFPRRLIKCMQWSAILSENEAASALRMMRDGFDFGGEAVNFYGGPLAVVSAAIRARNIVRGMHYYNTPLRIN